MRLISGPQRSNSAFWSASISCGVLPWAIAGVVGIAVVNLLVSFALALYVAMKSRQLGFAQLWQLGGVLLGRFARSPLSFFRAP